MGVVMGGALLLPSVAGHVTSLPFMEALGLSTYAKAAISVILMIYGVAAVINLFIPDTGIRYPKSSFEPIKTLCSFMGSCMSLWKDKLGLTSLIVTSMFWGAGAVLQFLVLAWGASNFGLSLSQASILQAVVSIGIALGAVGAARFIPLKKSLKVLPMGVLMGLVVAAAAFFRTEYMPWSIELPGGVAISGAILVAGLIMIAVGTLAGFFVVPMNALLQHRGYVLMSAGRSIAVQNFNENTSMLLMLGIYSLMISTGLSTETIMWMFGLLVSGGMMLVIRMHRRHQASEDLTALIGQEKKF